MNSQGSLLRTATQEFIQLALVHPPLPQPRRSTRRKATQRNRNYSVYFPTSDKSPTWRTTAYAHDDITSWAYRGSSTRVRVSHPMSMRPRPRPQATHGGPTPAQEIVARYREAQMDTERGARGRRTSHTSSVHNGRTGYCGSSTSELPGPRVRVRFSQADALEDARREAYGMMLRGGRGNCDIPCQRPGCGNILRDMQALAAHLHIHNLEGRYHNLYSNHASVSRWPSRLNHRRSQHIERYPSADMLTRKTRRKRVWDKLARWCCVCAHHIED
ncbi:hypothetical protein OBBRIDRAFT_794008 [Obba rivulosa]|uniref:C2H2-type domain-containing protein n=1 Tax=Obba rivulosa TaxID=1052685 RepID=A0A8E2ASQ3_9APHY|nr:hypothetical protein OBBRIDRAFT_794008 [Obba rivulosa]